MDLAGRLSASGHSRGYAPNPAGWTSSGEGLGRAHNLPAPVTEFAIKAIVVLTDEQENHEDFTRRFIAKVASLIDDCVYAIGLGTPQNLRSARGQEVQREPGVWYVPSFTASTTRPMTIHQP